MKKTLFLLFAATLTLAYPLEAQNLESSVREDPAKAAGIYNPYSYTPSQETPAPRGYKPFYVSHYGRHGSRYHTSIRYTSRSVEGLSAAEELLTDAGKEVLAYVKELNDMHDGMQGQLSEKGAKEHREIASRMYRKYKRVFRKRSEVHCVSSTIQRCIISMANFCTELKGLRPKLQFSYLTGEKYMPLVLNDIVADGVREDSDHLQDSLIANCCHYDGLYSVLFTDPEKAAELTGDRAAFARTLFYTGSISGDMEMENVVFKYYPIDELVEQAAVNSDAFYARFGGSREWWQETAKAGQRQLSDFVQKADEALAKGSNVAADLRFGHDTGIAPLAVCMGIEGYAEKMPRERAHEQWILGDKCPMGTNIQIIFYKNRKGSVLAKILFNEKETAVKELESFEGPYYKWDELRAYFLSRCEQFKYEPGPKREQGPSGMPPRQGPPQGQPRPDLQPGQQMGGQPPRQAGPSSRPKP